MNIAERINSEFSALGLRTIPNVNAVAEAYSADDRHYHNLSHIESCLAWLDQMAPSRPELAIALCYHDVVYDSRASDNEWKSAEWAIRDLRAAGASKSLEETIWRLIMATRHHSVPERDDELIVVDVDLAILGSGEKEYRQYAEAIRQEYAWVPDADFQKGRAAFLDGMLRRYFIFQTKPMQENLEAAARLNMKRELASLTKSA